ncbi:MAG TPA: fibronectin type III domain-containing protein [Baekduia sp.]|nr:fibronectin type III domain-containing protein [Baekduia sp.]
MDRRRWAPRLATALVTALALPAAAQAATAPAVTTGGAANRTPTSVRLTGTVDPNGAPTTYQFQYGTTSAYGAVTAERTVTGDGKRTVTVDVTGLAPATKYHYRLIAHNERGLRRGRHRTFKTRIQPLGVTLTATPNPLPFGGTTTLSGTLTGTNSANRRIVLESNPFPYTQGFQPVGNQLVTDAQGTFSFGLQAVPFNTQYRVALPEKPDVISPIVVVSVTPIIGTVVSRRHLHKGRQVTFKGRIHPALDGTPLAIQRRRRGEWVTIAGMAAHHGASSYSRYRKRIRLAKSGLYRVYAGVSTGSYVPATGREIRFYVG